MSGVGLGQCYHRETFLMNISYLSRKFTKAEKTYLIIEREA